MSATKEINPSVLALVDFLKSNPNTAYTFAEMADGAGVARATGFLRGVKAILGESLSIGSKDVEGTKEIGAFGYEANEPFTPSEKSNPSDNSKAVANFFREHEGEYHTLDEMSELLGFKVVSGYLSGARAILGKANIVKHMVERPIVESKTSYTYIG